MKISVIKLSGKSINDFISSDRWVEMLIRLQKQTDGIVIVHGAGTTITEWADKLGYHSSFVNGQRVTTKEMMSVVAAVQGGLINSRLTAKLFSSGIDTIGLSGIDRNTFTAKYLDEKMGFVGKPEFSGSITWIKKLLKDKVIPVFSSICSDHEGNLMNVNADLFTEMLSASLKADVVYFVSDVNGVKFQNRVKEFLTPEEIDDGINSFEITGGMVPKLNSCSMLLNKGVKKIWIGSDLINHLNGNTNGTFIVENIEQNKLKVA